MSVRRWPPPAPPSQGAPAPPSERPSREDHMRKQHHRQSTPSPIITILVVAGPGVVIAVAGRPGIAWAAAAVVAALANLADLLTIDKDHPEPALGQVAATLGLDALAGHLAPQRPRRRSIRAALRTSAAIERLLSRLDVPHEHRYACGWSTSSSARTRPARMASSVHPSGLCAGSSPPCSLLAHSFSAIWMIQSSISALLVHRSRSTSYR